MASSNLCCSGAGFTHNTNATTKPKKKREQPSQHNVHNKQGRNERAKKCVKRTGDVINSIKLTGEGRTNKWSRSRKDGTNGGGGGDGGGNDGDYDDDDKEEKKEKKRKRTAVQRDHAVCATLTLCDCVREDRPYKSASPATKLQFETSAKVLDWTFSPLFFFLQKVSLIHRHDFSSRSILPSRERGKKLCVSLPMKNRRRRRCRVRARVHIQQCIHIIMSERFDWRMFGALG